MPASAPDSARGLFARVAEDVTGTPAWCGGASRLAVRSALRVLLPSRRCVGHRLLRREGLGRDEEKSVVSLFTSRSTSAMCVPSTSNVASVNCSSSNILSMLEAIDEGPTCHRGMAKPRATSPQLEILRMQAFLMSGTITLPSPSIATAPG